MPRLRSAALVIMGLLLAAPARADVSAAATTTTAADATFRVFLKTGEALPSYGEAVQVGDRLVFNLLVSPGTAGQPSLQLMSLPTSAVDLDRTARYAQSMRAAYYARTRGETDYQAAMADVARTLDTLPSIEDKKQRLAVAERARQRLLDWSKANYDYRAADVRTVANMFDDVIAELRASAGESSFSLDLVATAAPAAKEPLMAAATPRESVALALTAAASDDLPEERMAVLRAAISAAAADPSLGDLADAAKQRMADETRVSSEYALLAASIRARANEALHKGDVAAVEALQSDLAARDRALGSARPREVHALAEDIAAALDATRAYRLKLDHYDYVRPSLLAYEREVRPALSTLSDDARLLEAIRDMRAVPFDDLVHAEARFASLQATLSEILPPADLDTVHATIASTIRMAHEACARRARAVMTDAMPTAREASAAAAGALILADHARADLVAGLYPPKLP